MVLKILFEHGINYFPCRCRFLRGFWLHRQRNFAVQMVRYGEVVVLA